MKNGKPWRKLSVTAAALLTCFSAISCAPNTIRSVSALRPDKTNPDRFVCELAGTRPTVPPELTINWAEIPTVAAAQEAFKAFVERVRAREGIVAGYVLTVEDHLFLCFNNMRWQREFYAGLPEQ